MGLKHREVKVAWERPRSYEVMLGFELGLTPVFLEVGVGGRLGSDPTEAPAYVWSVRLESAQHRASGTTAAEQSTLSSVDQMINTGLHLWERLRPPTLLHMGQTVRTALEGQSYPKGLSLVCTLENETRKGAGKAGGSLHQR